MADCCSGFQGPQGPQNAPCDVEVDFSSLSDLCGLMPRRLLVTGILTQWLRYHFTYPDNIENPFLKEALWDAELSETKIMIDSVFKFNAAATEFRPGIFIKPGPWKILRYGIDDRKMVGTRRTDECSDRHRVTNYNAMVQGSHTVFCVAGESGEVEILAAEVYRELMSFGPIARRKFNFLRFVVSDIGEPSLIEEATENFVVPIIVSYGASESWRICPPCCMDDSFGVNLWKSVDIDITDDVE